MNRPHPLSARLALWTFLAAIPLVAFGGSITTLGAGMAVEGWWDAEGHFLPLFPLEKWFRDLGTFVEHTHRLFGMLVGLLAIGCVLADALRRPRHGARLAWSVGALVAVCIQGAIGGFRVLENSPELAQLHGLVGQVVFALLGWNALVHSERWNLARGARTPAPVGGAAAVLLLILAQITVGVYYRHGLRPIPLEGTEELLWVHLVLGFGVLGAVVWLGRSLARAAEPSAAFGAALLAQKRRLHALLGVQILLGFAAWLSRDPADPDHVSKLLLFSSLAHVTVGALLLAQGGATLAWARRARAGTT